MSLGNSDQPIKTIATVKTVQELEKIYITTNKGLKVQLSEIAQIVDTNSEQSSGAYLNGKAVVGFEVNKAKNYGEIEVYESVTKEIKKILKTVVEDEDKSKPYSDEQLVDILKEKGYPIARRTIAKYRDLLDIPVARMRKKI